MRPTRRRARTGLVSIAALLAAGILASSASASLTFGSDLLEPPGATGSGCAPNGCTEVMTQVKAANLYPAASPIDGVVVRFGIRTSAAQTGYFVLARVDGSGNGAIAALGPPENSLGAGTDSVPARVRVHAGEFVGFSRYLGDSFLPASCAGGGYAYLYDPALPGNGTSQAPFLSGSCERLLNATVEPDADGDGFGDETQDACPANATTQGTCPAPAKKKCKKKHGKARKKCKKKAKRG